MPVNNCAGELAPIEIARCDCPTAQKGEKAAHLRIRAHNRLDLQTLDESTEVLTLFVAYWFVARACQRNFEAICEVAQHVKGADPVTSIGRKRDPMGQHQQCWGMARCLFCWTRREL